MGIERIALEDHGYVTISRSHIVHHGISDGDASERHVLETGNHAKSRGLAAPRRPQEDQELAISDLEVEAVHGGDVPKFLGDTLESDPGHRSSAVREIDRSRLKIDAVEILWCAPPNRVTIWMSIDLNVH